MNTPASFKIQITKLIYGGDGLGRLPDGRAAFVPLVIPGEQVHVQLVEEKRRYARGQLLEVLESSPDRVSTWRGGASLGGVLYGLPNTVAGPRFP